MMPQNIPRAHECLENSDKFHYVNSFTPVNRILSFRESEMKDSCKLANDFKKETDEQNILIDVVGECAERIESKLKNEPVTCNDFMYHSGFSDSNEKNHIEMCSGSKYVKDQIDSVNKFFNKSNLSLPYYNCFSTLAESKDKSSFSNSK